MHFSAALIVVTDMERSRNFYETILDQKIQFDFGENVAFESGLSLQTKASWEKMIEKNPEDVRFCSHSFELYFEEEQFDAFLMNLQAFCVEFVHPPKKHSWQQRVVRIYDPDGHIIEIGEAMSSVIKNLFKQGYSKEETARITQHPLSFIEQVLDKM